MQGNMWFIPRRLLVLAAMQRQNGAHRWGVCARGSLYLHLRARSFIRFYFGERLVAKYYRQIRTPALFDCHDFLRLPDVKRLGGGRRRSRRGTFFRFRSWIVNHINLLSYRPQWRLRWFMWFQLYGFVNLQPYIIHEFIFHVFSFLPPPHTRITKSDS